MRAWTDGILFTAIRTAKLENIVRTIAGQRQNNNKNAKNSLCCRWYFANQAKRVALAGNTAYVIKL